MGQTGRVRDAPTRKNLNKGAVRGAWQARRSELGFRAELLSLGAWTPTPIPGAPPKRAVLERSSLIRKGARAPKRPAVEGCARPGVLGGLHGAQGVAPAYRPRSGLGLRRRGPSPGFPRPYRSGSGSLPQCCGPRTRTEDPPSSGSLADLSNTAHSRDLRSEAGRRRPQRGEARAALARAAG